MVKIKTLELPESQSNNTDISNTEYSETECSYTDLSETDISETEVIQSHPIQSSGAIVRDRKDVIEEMNIYRELRELKCKMQEMGIVGGCF